LREEQVGEVLVLAQLVRVLGEQGIDRALFDEATAGGSESSICQPGLAFALMDQDSSSASQLASTLRGRSVQQAPSQDAGGFCRRHLARSVPENQLSAHVALELRHGRRHWTSTIVHHSATVEGPQLRRWRRMKRTGSRLISELWEGSLSVQEPTPGMEQLSSGALQSVRCNRRARGASRRVCAFAKRRWL
jgi:hypothetical protein